MANNFEITLPATAFVGDSDENLVAGDAAATPENHNGRPCLAFDATDEEAAISHEFAWPDAYTGSGTLKADILIAADSDNTNGCVFDVFVEAKTPADTLDMETADSWDAANSSGDIDLAGSTAGDPIAKTVTLTNKDSVASDDSVRIGIRRDTDHANDDASGDVYVYWVRIREEA